MTSITDKLKFVDANVSTIEKFQRSSLDVLAWIVVSTLTGVLLNFDQSVAKFALPDYEWNEQPIVYL